MAKKNTNCLEGMKCPRCKSLGPYMIDARAAFEAHDDGVTFEGGDITWDEDSHCVCCECGLTASVRFYKKVRKPKCTKVKSKTS